MESPGGGCRGGEKNVTKNVPSLFRCRLVKSSNILRILKRRDPCLSESSQTHALRALGRPLAFPPGEPDGRKYLDDERESRHCGKGESSSAGSKKVKGTCGLLKQGRAVSGNFQIQSHTGK